MLRFLVLASALVALSLAAESKKNECHKGPSYWCQNDVIATKCGVKSFCNIIKDGKIRFHPSVPKKTVEVGPPPVNVSFYYESLCPGCRGVWRDQLYPTYQKLASSGIVNFEFIPYGNAQEQPYGSSWYFTCQHGSAECLGNLIETCAIHYNPDASKIIPFLHCLEEYGPTQTNAQYCAGIAKIDYNTIYTCSEGDEGKQLEHRMALKTEALNPPHQYVPWLTMNGQHTTAIQNGLSSNMLATICNAYTGAKPAACSQAKQTICVKKH
ncbi:gamma-interferon-inducible lysosomal thiol reductase-like [Clytia hemisphaerica]|uniref:Saposin A-type domain-containing protein n=1 Tax=Clytia hemisphaerica TaxID=252671 RepID=A0A7M5WI26_9CNID